MKKFVLKVSKYHIYPRASERSRELMSLERNFTSACISTDETVGGRLMEVVERFGKRLNNLGLSFDQSEFSGEWNPRVTLNILQQTAGLEKLRLVFHEKLCRKPDTPTDVAVGSVKLQKLKQLQFRGNCDVYALIEAPQLVHLKSRHEELPYFQLSDFTHFEKFLKAAPKLQCLETQLNVFNELNPGFPFQLKRIVGLDSFELSDQIRKFLLSQASTVETFEGDCDDSELHELVLTNFKRLRAIKANFAAPPDFYSNLKPMPLLKEISSPAGFSSESAMQAVLGKCPELLKLECAEDIDLPNRLVFIAEHNKRLKVLGVRTIRGTNAKFQCLQELIVATVKETNHLIAFLKLNPTVETLDIQWLSFNDLLTVDVSSLITETSLKLVKMSGYKREMEKVFNETQSKFGSWTKLTLSTEFESMLKIEITRKLRPRGTKRKQPVHKLSPVTKRFCSIQ